MTEATSSSSTTWITWEGPRVRVLPILLIIVIGAIIVFASFFLGQLILLSTDKALLDRGWPLLMIAESFECFLALMAMKLARRRLPQVDFKLHWPRGKSMIGPAVLWGLVFGVVMLIADHGPVLIHGRAPVSPAHSTLDAVGWLAFQLLFVGICEEMLFRGLLLGVLETMSPSRLCVKNVSLGTAGIVVALLFALAHAQNFTTLPWPVALAQQLYAFALGLLYAWLRERSNSLVAPMVAHSLSDFIEIAAVIFLAARLK